MTKEEILNKYNIKIDSIKRIGKVIIIYSKDKNYALKKQVRKSDFYDYLISRGFNNFPKVYSNIDDEIELTDYIEDKEVPKEQRVEDLVLLVSILHSKTLFDKQVDIDYIKRIYEDMINKQEEYLKYYSNLQDIIEEEEYMSPSNYYLIRNISLIYKSLNLSRKYLEKWYSEVIKTKTLRYAYIHNNLKKEHLIENNNLYLISWDNSRIDNIIYDLENLYLNNYSFISINDLLKIYNSKLVLKKEEKNLFFSLILMPEKIELKKDQLLTLKELTNMILRLEVVLEQLNDSKKANNNTNQDNKNQEDI